MNIHSDLNGIGLKGWYIVALITLKSAQLPVVIDAPKGVVIECTIAKYNEVY